MHMGVLIGMHIGMLIGMPMAVLIGMHIGMPMAVLMAMHILLAHPTTCTSYYLLFVSQEEWTTNPWSSRKFIAGKLLYQKGRACS